MSDANAVAGAAKANVADTAESLLTKGEHFVEAVGHLAKLVGVEIVPLIAAARAPTRTDHVFHSRRAWETNSTDVYFCNSSKEAAMIAKAKDIYRIIIV